MGLDALLSRLESRAVTPVTPAETVGVTARPAPALPCTPVTSFTAPAGIAVQPSATPSPLHFPDQDSVAFTPAVDHASGFEAYPEAIAAEPIAATAERVPADLMMISDACERACVYNEAARVALPAMLALDAADARGLSEAMYSRIGECRRCRRFRQPGLSDGYCTERSDLEHVYGLMRRLPDDGGADCEAFEATRSRRTRLGLPQRRR